MKTPVSTGAFSLGQSLNDVRPDFNWNRTATAMMGYR